MLRGRKENNVSLVVNTLKANNDPNVKMPPAVMAKIKAADDLHKTLYPQPQEPQDPQAPQAPQEPQAPQAAEPQAPQAPQPPQEPQAPQAPQAAPDGPAPQQNWEHAYKSMKGRFDRAAANNAELLAELQNARNALQEASRQAREQARDAPPDVAPERLITDQELSDYGPDLLNVVGKKAKEEFAPIIAQLKGEVQALKDQLRGTNREVVRSARERLVDALNEHCPQWGALNEDQEFISWLQLPDPYSGAIRSELLNAAYERNDSPRVLAFFQGYLREVASDPAREQGLPAPTAVAALPAATGREQHQGKVPLETFAAPGRAKATAAPAPVEKPVYSPADITEFYTNKAAGRYTAEQAAGYERSIMDAMREGRIRR